MVDRALQEDLDMDKYLIEEKIKIDKDQCTKVAIKFLILLLSGRFKNILSEKAVGLADTIKGVARDKNLSDKEKSDPFLYSTKYFDIKKYHKDIHDTIFEDILSKVEACSDITKTPKQFFTQKLCHYFGSLMKNNLNAIKHKTCVKAK